MCTSKFTFASTTTHSEIKMNKILRVSFTLRPTVNRDTFIVGWKHKLMLHTQIQNMLELLTLYLFIYFAILLSLFLLLQSQMEWFSFSLFSSFVSFGRLKSVLLLVLLFQMKYERPYCFNVAIYLSTHYWYEIIYSFMSLSATVNFNRWIDQSILNQTESHVKMIRITFVEECDSKHQINGEVEKKRGRFDRKIFSLLCVHECVWGAMASRDVEKYSNEMDE